MRLAFERPNPTDHVGERGVKINLWFSFVRVIFLCEAR